ncbi:MAG TPA: matrixin family metalloprotease, partial [Polyangiales bacterium]|nr:matrixin family metalloprotease [Polyangiales bacterium]
MAGQPAFAQGFCRESLRTPPTGPCVEPAGVPLLHWTRGCFTQTFNEQVFQRLTALDERQVRAIFHEAFATWRDVDCGNDAPTFFVTQASGVTKTTAIEGVLDARNIGVIAAPHAREWEAEGPAHGPEVVALTSIWHDSKTGEIFDVDMELNVDFGQFADCDRGCVGDQVDLLNTVTHEAGHLLGLGHSPNVDATMYEAAPPGQTSKRSLARDDEHGYCALDLPESDCEGDSSKCTCPAPPIFASRTLTRGGACAVAS